MILQIILFLFIQNADGNPWCLFPVILILGIIQMYVHDITAHVYVKYYIYDWLNHSFSAHAFNPIYL